MKRRRAEQKKKLYGLESGIPAAAEIACCWEQEGKEAKVEKLPLTVREGRQYLGKKKEEGKETGQWDQQIEKLKERYRKKESVKERGVITPATVRQKEDGRYEIISGHRRKRACELAGFETLRCEVVDLDRDEAIILMVESNYQRSRCV